LWWWWEGHDLRAPRERFERQLIGRATTRRRDARPFRLGLCASGSGCARGARALHETSDPVREALAHCMKRSCIARETRPCARGAGALAEPLKSCARRSRVPMIHVRVRGAMRGAGARSGLHGRRCAERARPASPRRARWSQARRSRASARPREAGEEGTTPPVRLRPGCGGARLPATARFWRASA